MIQKAFEVGNSTVLTIPKSAGVESGTKVKFKQENNKLIFELIDAKTLKTYKDSIRKTSGAFKIRIPNIKQVLTSLKENSYDKEIRIS